MAPTTVKACRQSMEELEHAYYLRDLAARDRLKAVIATVTVTAPLDS